MANSLSPFLPLPLPLSPGPSSALSVMVRGLTDRLAPDSDFMVWDNETNSSVVDTDSQDERSTQINSAVTILAGIFQVIVGTQFKRLGYFWGFFVFFNCVFICSLDFSGFDSLWSCGVFPLWPSGARLHHSSWLPYHFVPVREHLWYPVCETQRTSRIHICK